MSKVTRTHSQANWSHPWVTDSLLDATALGVESVQRNTVNILPQLSL
jgi:hypothetical protein